MDQRTLFDIKVQDSKYCFFCEKGRKVHQRCLKDFYNDVLRYRTDKFGNYTFNPNTCLFDHPTKPPLAMFKI